MRKKNKPPPQWAVRLETVYRPDHDERVRKIFALVLPVIGSKPNQKPIHKENDHESSTLRRHLLPRLQ